MFLAVMYIIVHVQSILIEVTQAIMHAVTIFLL